VTALVIVLVAGVLLDGTSPRVDSLQTEGVVVLAGHAPIACSSFTDNCMGSKCCKDAGFTCYKKNEHYANCNKTCTPGINHQDPEEHRTPWSCDILGDPAVSTCSSSTENCKDTKCCKDAGFTCFEKNEHYSNCNKTCTPGVNEADPAEHRTPWSCKYGGEKPASACSSYTDNCKETKRCQDPEATCFEKNEHYASCNKTCTPGINHQDPEEHRTPWTCKILGKPAPAACSKASENCMDTKCCKDAGFTCFKKNEYHASCNKTCSPGINHQDPEEHRTPWSCDILGDPAVSTCSSSTENCKDTKCCKDAGFTCFEKNEHYSNCNKTCVKGVNEADPAAHRTEWSCAIQGPTAGNKGAPSCECSEWGPNSYPRQTRCLQDGEGDPHHFWTCDVDIGCMAPHPSLCRGCTHSSGKQGFWSLTYYCCPAGHSPFSFIPVPDWLKIPR